jgi:hypothetical protein
MNNIFKSGRGIALGVFAFVALCTSIAFSFKSPDVAPRVAVQYTDENDNTSTVWYAGSAQQKKFDLDTLSGGTATTTVTVPWNMSSPYQYQYFFKLRKISGTPNTKIVLDERNAANSAVWSAIDSVSCSGADSLKLNFRLRGSVVYGSYHRLRFVHTGTHSLARNMEFVIKPTN